jgi:hypothetical protein
MKTSISLGWDCGPAIYGVDNKLRLRKSEGYKTCPFDMMISNYKGVIECINDDFKYFCSPEYLKVVKIIDKYNHLNLPLGSTILVNTKYNFVMNHESSGHGDLWISENWPKGKFHYEMNNFEEFIKRYERRIENFRYYMNNCYEVTFLISKINNTSETNLELDNVIRNKYPNTQINFKFLEETRTEIFNEAMHIANKIETYYKYNTDDYNICFVIAHKYIRNYPSYIEYYVENIQNFYKNSLIIIVDNNSNNFEDILEKLKKYYNKNLIILTNNTESKFEFGAYKVGINYILSNNILHNYDYYIFTQDSFILKHKYDFNNLIVNNVFACPIKTHINDTYNRHNHDYQEGFVYDIVKKMNLENRTQELRICWANSFLLHKSKIIDFILIASDIVTKNKADACSCERFLSPILYKLNNYRNYTVDDIYSEEEIDNLWVFNPITFIENKFCFVKKLTNKDENTV